MALLRWYVKPRFLCISLLFLIFLLILDSLWFRSGEFAGQSSTPTPCHLTTFGAFGSVDRSQILLENEISIFKKLVSREET